MLVNLENAKLIIGMSEKYDSNFISLVVSCRFCEKYFLRYDYGRKWLYELSELNACFL
jgi:hypothetical protein